MQNVSVGKTCSTTENRSKRMHRGRAKALESAIRVDHAGEIAANYIYRGQMAVLGGDRIVGPVIQVRPS